VTSRAGSHAPLFSNEVHVGQDVGGRDATVERCRKRNRDYVLAEVLWTTPGGRGLQRSRKHQSFLVDEPSAAVVVDKDRERRADRRFDLPSGPGEQLCAVSSPS